MSLSSLSTLVLYADYTTRLSYYDDWLDAFRQAREFDCRELNICQRGIGEALKAALPEADLVVLLHSTNGDTTIYLEPLVPLLAARKGLLLSFVGNEVSLPGSPISAKRAVFQAIRPDFIATQLPLDAGEYLWGDLVGRRVLAIPHALNPQAFRPEQPDERRTVDIGVRAVRYLAHLGDDERNRLHDLFATPGGAPGLTVDISTERLDRAGWAGFLNTCKGTVSSEAGSWFLERDDATMEAIRAWTAERFRGRGMMIANDSPLRRLGHKLPWWMRAAARKMLSRGVIRHESTVNEELTFAEVHERFFQGRQRPDFYGKCISSRHFDAIGTGTCQILIEGRYNGILTAGEHYIPLSTDFANLEEALDTFRDPACRTRITEAARAHALARHTYAHRVRDIRDAAA
ncbi:glycosyltransferase family protein [Caenispirillum bisanense]|uniref:glycosyltransferase family protein n=1 Tax=Caenispirillum bisanense TaxID=414052 RepID=UPI0031DD8ECA